LPLDQSIRHARREIGPPALAALVVAKNVGLVRPAIDRATAQFRQPYRFRTRHPGCRRGAAHATRPVKMLLRPERSDILVAPDPVLAMRTIADWAADLRATVGVAGIVPVDP